MSLILEAVGLSKSFLLNSESRLILKGHHWGWRRVNFDHYWGSGCGKSTFLELLAGLQDPIAAV
jgi:ABC-type nitrate/sulfonate/bicarbonate transport system ATPase subunit